MFCLELKVVSSNPESPQKKTSNKITIQAVKNGSSQAHTAETQIEQDNITFLS